MLRHNSCVSTFEDLGPNSKFEPVIGHINSKSIENCEAIIFCAGKFVYDVEGAVKAKNSEKTAILTIEEIFPFPEQQVRELLSKASKNSSVYWVQE